MYRERVLLLGVSLAVFASLGALGGMGYLSWQSGLRQEQAHLQRYATGAIERTRDAFTEIDEAFDTLSRSNVVPCSPRHIEELRLATLDTRSAEDVAYFRDGRLLCSSWGALRGHIPRAASDFTTGDGMGVSTHVQPHIRDAPSMLVLHRGGYSALVNPQRLVDVLADDDVQIAVYAPGGAPITASTPAPNTAAVPSSRERGRLPCSRASRRRFSVGCSVFSPADSFSDITGTAAGDAGVRARSVP